MILLVCLIFASYCLSAITSRLLIADGKAAERYIEFVDGQMKVNEALVVIDERYRGVVRLAIEAHEKYKFKNGIVYFNNNDGEAHSDALHDNRIYYTAFSSKQAKYYKDHSGPDFSCNAWPSAYIFSFVDETKRIMEASLKKPKTQKVGWIGNVQMGHNRGRLIGFTHEHPDYFDFRHLAGDKIKPESPEYVSIPQLVVNNTFLLDIQGQGYSGRLKYLLYSNRPLFYVERDFVEYFNDELRPMVHYIPIKNDLSNLLQQYKWASENPDKAKEIASNALSYAQENLVHDKFVDRLAKTFQILLEANSTKA